MSIADEHIYGEYYFRNSFFINIRNDDKAGTQTILHELGHLELSMETKYGCFLRMCEKISTIDPIYKFICIHLIDHSRKSQEAYCVFLELSFLMRHNQFETAEGYIQYLRDNNREYYNYLKPLLPFFDHLSINTISPKNFKTSCKDMLSIIKKMIYLSHNIDLTEIDVEKYRSKKELERFFVKDDNPQKYYPDSRFKTYVKEMLSIMEQDGDSDSIFCLIERWFSNKNAHLNSEDVESWLNKIREFMKELYRNSNFHEDVFDLIDNFQVQLIDRISIQGTGIPSSFNRQYEIDDKWYDISSKDNFIHLCNSQNGILFILGKRKETLQQISNRLYIPRSTLDNVSNHICDALFLSYDKKKQYAFQCNDTDIEQICLSLNENVPIAIQYKSYDTMQKVFCSYQRPLFYYCDRAYTHSVDIINEMSCGVNKPFAVLQYDELSALSGLSVLLVELQTNRFFYLPMLNNSYMVLLRDLEFQRVKLSDSLNISQDMLNDIDALTNCLLFI